MNLRYGSGYVIREVGFIADTRNHFNLWNGMSLLVCRVATNPLQTTFKCPLRAPAYVHINLNTHEETLISLIILDKVQNA